MTKEIWDGKLVETQDVDMSYSSRNQRYAEITSKDEEESAILKYQARRDAEEWCKAHDIPTNHIRETEKGYRVTMEFNY